MHRVGSATIDIQLSTCTDSVYILHNGQNVRHTRHDFLCVCNSSHSSPFIYMLLHLCTCTRTEVLCMCICNFETEPGQVWSAEQVGVHLLTVLVDYLWYGEILSETYSIYVRI